MAIPPRSFSVGQESVFFTAAQQGAESNSKIYPPPRPLPTPQETQLRPFLLGSRPLTEFFQHLSCIRWQFFIHEKNVALRSPTVKKFGLDLVMADETYTAFQYVTSFHLRNVKIVSTFVMSVIWDNVYRSQEQSAVGS